MPVRRNAGWWDNTTSYAVGNVVEHSGNEYVALQASTGTTPIDGAVWALLALTGAQGPQGIQGVPGPSILSVAKLTADTPGKTDATLANTGLLFSVVAGSYYTFEFTGAYRSTVTTVGLKLGLVVPAFTVFCAQAQIGGVAADAPASVFNGVINVSGDSVISTATVPINTDLPWRIHGILLPSANGNLTVQYAAETTGASVLLRQGSVGILTVI